MGDSMSKTQEVSPEPSPQSQTILVVDDERMVLEVVCKILRLYGYAVLEANHGIEALRICHEHVGPIHLLLTDVLMPGMNGPHLAQQVATLHSHTRVLYMSGYPDNDSLAYFGLHPEIAFIQKPFLPDVLIRKVREVLGAPG